LYFSKTTECRMSDVCLYFEDLLVEIKVQYIDKKEEISDRLWYAANAAYTKLTKYYTKISSENFSIATVLDPRYKLDVYLKTQDPIELRASAKLAIEISYEKYSEMHSRRETITIVPTAVNPPSKKLKFVCDDESELDIPNELITYLQEKRVKGSVDPLDYWRLNKTRFPILATMARDYLALQPTSKDVEGNFSKGRRTIPYYRRSQNASGIRNQMLVNSGFNLGVFS
jgi:hAT family C-terminal dimerisation region/Domain of unknown function (DUF4413)